MIRKSAKACLSLLLMSAAGCSALQDYVIDVETDMRNCVLAQKAWGEWSWCYDDLDYPYHFSKGFKVGYENILAGGKGCQPTLPPRWYWKPCYQTPEGRCKIAAWFDGFSHGALAAQQDGYGNLQALPISPTARANWMSRHAPPSSACFDGMYHGPIPTDENALDMPGEMSPEESPVDADADSARGRAVLDNEGILLRPYEEPEENAAP